MPKTVNTTNKPTVPKFWNMSEIDTDGAEITLYGEIVSHHPTDWWTGEKSNNLYISPEGFLEDLNKIKGKSKLTIRINSVGGDLYTGMAIYTQLKCLSANKTVIIDGIAASAASLIAMAGDTIKIAAGGTIMIHSPLSKMQGYYNKSSIERVTATLDILASAAAETYATKTKLSVEDIRTLMSAETWFTGREAVEKGFADELLFEEQDKPEISLNKEKTMLLSHGIKMSIAGLCNVPRHIKVNVENSTPADIMPLKNKLTQGGQLKMETVEELKTTYPQLLAQIITEAAAKGAMEERTRLQGIDDIQAAIATPELISEAKYGEHPCTAQELAFKAIQEQVKTGKTFIADMKKDCATSGVQNVMSTPNKGLELASNINFDESKAQADAIALIVGGDSNE